MVRNRRTVEIGRANFSGIWDMTPFPIAVAKMKTVPFSHLFFIITSTETVAKKVLRKTRYLPRFSGSAMENKKTTDDITVMQYKTTSLPKATSVLSTLKTA